MVNYKWLSRSFHGIGAPQVEQLSGARDGQSDEGAPARPIVISNFASSNFRN